jgi:hypothetical protein
LRREEAANRAMSDEDRERDAEQARRRLPRNPRESRERSGSQEQHEERMRRWAADNRARADAAREAHAREQAERYRNYQNRDRP